VRSSSAALTPRRLRHLPGAAERTACVLLVLACVCLAACRNEQAGRAGGDAGSVPQAVMEHGVLLLNGSIPEHLAVSASAGGDYEVTPAARANGVEASFAVSWSGVERMSDGRAEDVSGSFTALKLASGAWQLFAGAGEVLNTLCASDGTFSTHGEDFSGVYAGATERGNYREIRLELRRDGATHTGTLRYTNPLGEVQTFRVLGFHRVAAEDVAVRHMDGRIEFWAQEEGSMRGRPNAAPAQTVEVRPGAITLGWLPPRQSVAATLHRRGG
jgi:predicted small secreted protein